MQKFTIPLSEKNRARIMAQAETWHKRRLDRSAPPPQASRFITISRQFGCGVYPIAEAIAEKLSAAGKKPSPWAVYDKSLMQKISEDHNLSADLVEALNEKRRSEFEDSLLGLLKGFTPEIKVYRSLVSTVRTIALHGNAILVGRGGAILTRDLPGGVHIRVISPREMRVKFAAERMNIPEGEAAGFISRMDEERESFVRKYLNTDVADPLHYHAIFNLAKASEREIVEAVTAMVKAS